MSSKNGEKKQVIVFHSGKYWSVLKPNDTPSIMDACAMIQAQNGINAKYLETVNISFNGPKKQNGVKKRKIEFVANIEICSRRKGKSRKGGNITDVESES